MATSAGNSTNCFRVEGVGRAKIKKCAPECGCGGLWAVDFLHTSKVRSHMCLRSWKACRDSALKSIKELAS